MSSDANHPLDPSLDPSGLRPVALVDEPLGAGLQIVFPLEEVYVERQTPFQHVLVAETAAYGRALFLDRLIQSAEADEVLYHEPLIHPGLVVHGHARRVLVAGAGEGASLRELVRHREVEHVLAIDLDPEVVAISREQLEDWHQGAFDDPRVELRFEDIQTTLAASAPAAWDVVVLDITDPVEEGPSVDLFTTKFFTDVARVLADDGLVIMQAGEIDPSDTRIISTTLSTLRAVFPWVRLLNTFVPSFHCLWGIALAGKRAFELEPADLVERIARLPQDRLQVYDEHRHRAMLRLPKFMQAMVDRPGRVITGEGDERLISYGEGSSS
ncbi:spermidine synthase [Nannocystaceae bacterium ST9]